MYIYGQVDFTQCMGTWWFNGASGSKRSVTKYIYSKLQHKVYLFYPGASSYNSSWGGCIAQRYPSPWLKFVVTCLYFVFFFSRQTLFQLEKWLSPLSFRYICLISFIYMAILELTNKYQVKHAKLGASGQLAIYVFGMHLVSHCYLFLIIGMMCINH